MIDYSKIGLDNRVIDVTVLSDDYADESKGIAYLKELTGHETWLLSERDGIRGLGMIGCYLDSVRKAWIYEQPYPSWILDDDGLWQPPIQEPALTQEQDDDDFFYNWNESLQLWELIQIHD